MTVKTFPVKLFVNGAALAFIPLALVILPLVFHTSGTPGIFSYSWPYFCFLLSCWAGVFAVSAALGKIAVRRGNVYASVMTVMIVFAVSYVFLLAEATISPKQKTAFSAYESWGHKKSPLFAFEARADGRWTISGATYSTDTYGFRTHAHAPQWTTARRPLIFTVGGSSVFGFGLNDDQTWTHRLEQKLRCQLDRSDISVINGGNNGHNSVQTMLRIYLRVLPHRPDYLLFYENINDIAAGYRYPTDIAITEEILFQPSLALYWAELNKRKNFYARSILGYLGYRYILHGGRTERQKAMGKLAGHRQVAFEAGALYSRNLNTIIDMCRREGTKIILATFIAGNAQKNLEKIRIQNDILRRVAQSRGVPLIDLEKLFQPVKHKAHYFFLDQYHPNPRGAAWIADRLCEHLSEKHLIAVSRSAPADHGVGRKPPVPVASL